MRRRHVLRRRFVVLAGCLALFLALCRRYDVVQDDAYISLVYARNLAAGDGLVFNPGERVEGYTNFLWTVLLALPHLVGVDAIAVARALGLAAALALVVLSWRTASALSARPRDGWHLAAPVLVAANGALAFWSLSGLETSAFALLVTLAATRYLRVGRLDGPTGALFGLAALTRPEGLLFCGLTAAHQLAVVAFGPHPRWPVLRQQWPAGAVLAALVVPHFLFRLAYYGYPLPNTFYAKTGVSLTYLYHGLRYTGRFLVDYGLFGLAPLALAGLLARRRTRPRAAYAGLLVGANLVYVTAVGGDTMAQNRLYLPVLAVLVAGVVEAARAGALALFGRRRRGAVQVCGLLGLLVATARSLVGADGDLRHARAATAAHNDKLHQLADYANADGGVRLLASTAIGIPRYRTGAAVLDLVGLTDETIAHRPVPLPGIRDDHILRHYEVAYALDRAPDLILFISGERPATPAERALFLSRRFRRGYDLVYLQDQRPLFRRRPEADAIAEELFPDGAFVELYAEALALRATAPERARALLAECVERGPADFAEPRYWLGRMLYEEGRFAEAAPQLRQALALDDRLAMAWPHLAFIELEAGRTGSALAMAQRGVDLAPGSHLCHYVLGRALVAAGREADGAAQLARALELGGPQSLDALYWIGVAAARTGATDAARAAWVSLLQRAPTRQDARRALEEIGR